MSGRRYLLLELDLERTGDDPATYTDANFFLHLGLGRAEVSNVGILVPVPRSDGGFAPGTLAKEDHHRGPLVFDVAVSERQFFLVYVTDFSGGASMGWWIAGDPAPEPTVVPADRCQVAPRRSVDPVKLTGTPAPGYFTAIPEGFRFEQAVKDPTMAAGVTTVMEQAVACINAGDRDRLAALVTDDFLPRSPDLITILHDGAGTLAPRALRIVSVEALRTWGSGSGPWARANVSVLDPARPGEVISALVMFRNVEGQWLIDEVQWDPWLMVAFDAAPVASPEAGA